MITSVFSNAPLKCLGRKALHLTFHKCPGRAPRLRWRCRLFSTALAEDNLENITPTSNIRNFSIIAHVDHGKSTLADRMLEMTGAIQETKENKQVLDRLQVEKERGITVKAVAASLKYQYEGEEYLLNLIDTPGHVDFANEVSRSLAACQGVILLIDANEGIQAQTVANFYLAFTLEKVIIPVLNKIDLKNADPVRVETQLKCLFGIEPSTVHRISAKTGLGVKELFERIVREVPGPVGDRAAPFRALVVDSWFDRFRGALSFVYVAAGHVRVGDEISSVETGRSYLVKTLGRLTPEEVATPLLAAGEVGVVSCNMRGAGEAVVGDTWCSKSSLHVASRLPGFTPAKPMVFAGLYPADQSQHTALRSAIERLSLNDPAVSVAMDTSPALGYGWRLGFLGLLHLDVFSQRLEQEYGTEVVLTAPSVTYKVRIKGAKNVKKYGGEVIAVSNPVLLPDPSNIEEISEPLVMATIITPNANIGDVISMCLEKRGVQQGSTYIDSDRVMMKFVLPLSEIIVDFHDTLKSITSGYASFDYEDHGYEASHLVKLTIVLNGKQVDELSTIVHGTQASTVGRRMVLRLKEMIPRQMIHIAIQATVGGTVVARENLKAFRKDVTAKLYGGDVTRRQKLLKQQTAGKKKMRMIANIQVPRDTFIDVLRKK